MTVFKIHFKMNEGQSCEQLMRKLETLSADSDSQVTKSILKLVQKLQNNIPEFAVPDGLELIKSDSVLPKPNKRRTRASRQSSVSSALSKKPKRRKISGSQTYSDSDGAQVSNLKALSCLHFSYNDLNLNSFLLKSMTTVISEMHTIPEEGSSPANKLKLNSTYVRSKSSKTAFEGTAQEEDNGQSTLLANTSKSVILSARPLLDNVSGFLYMFGYRVFFPICSIYVRKDLHVKWIYFKPFDLFLSFHSYVFDRFRRKKLIRHFQLWKSDSVCLKLKIKTKLDH